MPRRLKLGALHVCVSTDLQDVQAAWADLEQNGICTYFQTRAWSLSWLRDIAPALNAKALFVVGLHDDGSAAFILPLQVRRKRGFDLLEFLSAPHATYGFGLYDKAFLQAEATHWFSLHFDSLLALLPRHDVVYLREVPNLMLGHRNPLARFARMKGANSAYMMALKPEFEGLLATRRSAETLRSMRKRDKRLADMGDIRFEVPSAPVERSNILDTMFRDHEQRLAETGVRGVYGPMERSFLSGLADPSQHGDMALKPYALYLNETPICVLLGGRACNVFWAMMTSLADGPWRKHSPGDYTLRRVIAEQCEVGLAWFDFAAGASDYKLAWVDTKIELLLALSASSMKGFALCVVLMTEHGLKRMVKENAALRQFAFYVRRIVFGHRTNT